MKQKGTNTALLVLDMQTMLLSRYSETTQFTSKVAASIKHAKQLGITVIYVTVGFRKGLPEIDPGNKRFSQLSSYLNNMEMEQMTEITPELPFDKKDDLKIVKKRHSAFSGSDLEIILQSKKIRHLVLCGTATGGVVLSTALEATDKDYMLTILSDGCLDQDIELHNMLMQKLFPRLAEVLSINDWMTQQ